MPGAELALDEPYRLAAVRKLNLIETPLDERFERITRLARQLFDVDIAAISLIESGRQWFKSIQGFDACETSRDASFCAHAILQPDRVTVVPDARQDPRFSDSPLVTGPPHIVFYAGCPILSADGFALGALCVISTVRRELRENEIHSLRDLAALASSEMQSASANAVQAALIEDVTAEHRRSLIDGLTRIWNRTGIIPFADETIKNAQRNAHGSALLMIDLDHFKTANDQHGHAAGDEILRACARRMIAAVREPDGVGRLGGDEFLIALGRCETEQDAQVVAERVLSHVIGSPVRTNAGELPIGASIGVKFISSDSNAPLDELMQEADEAMYQAKQAGRNQIRFSAKRVDLRELNHNNRRYST